MGKVMFSEAGNVYIRNIKVFIISVFGGIFFKNNNITLYDFINYLLKLIIALVSRFSVFMLSCMGICATSLIGYSLCSVP